MKLGISIGRPVVVQRLDPICPQAAVKIVNGLHTLKPTPFISPPHLPQNTPGLPPPGHDVTVPRLPLDIFDAYDLDDPAQIAPRTAVQAAAGLPRDLHMALVGALLLAHTQGQAAAAEARAGNPQARRWVRFGRRRTAGLVWQSLSVWECTALHNQSVNSHPSNPPTPPHPPCTHPLPSPLTYEAVSVLANTALEAAGALRRDVVKTIRGIYGTARIEVRRAGGRGGALYPVYVQNVSGLGGALLHNRELRFQFFVTYK